MNLPDVKEHFEIIYRTKDDDSYFYSNTDYTWYVRSLQTGDEVFCFSGYSNADANSSSEGGISSVHLDGYKVIARHFDGKLEEHKLPIDIQIVEKGNAIELLYDDGRKEKRKRKQVVYFLKFGQVVQLPLL